MITTGGAVVSLNITQTILPHGAVEIQAGEVEIVDKGDGRGVTSINWLQVSTDMSMGRTRS
jgi:hypothetical protein